MFYFQIDFADLFVIKINLLEDLKYLKTSKASYKVPIQKILTIISLPQNLLSEITDYKS